MLARQRNGNAQNFQSEIVTTASNKINVEGVDNAEGSYIVMPQAQIDSKVYNSGSRVTTNNQSVVAE